MCRLPEEYTKQTGEKRGVYTTATPLNRKGSTPEPPAKAESPGARSAEPKPSMAWPTNGGHVCEAVAKPLGVHRREGAPHFETSSPSSPRKKLRGSKRTQAMEPLSAESPNERPPERACERRRADGGGRERGAEPRDTRSFLEGRGLASGVTKQTKGKSGTTKTDREARAGGWSRFLWWSVAFRLRSGRLN